MLNGVGARTHPCVTPLWVVFHPLSICLLESVMTSPDFVFSGAVLLKVGPVAFLISSYTPLVFPVQTMSGCSGRVIANSYLHNGEQFVGLCSLQLLAQSCSFDLDLF